MNSNTTTYTTPEENSYLFGSRAEPSKEAVEKSDGRALKMLRENGRLDNPELDWRFEKLEASLWEAGFFKVLRYYKNFRSYRVDRSLNFHRWPETYDMRVSYQCCRDFCTRVQNFLTTSTHVQAYRNFFDLKSLAVLQENPALLDSVISRDKTKLNTTCTFYIYRANCLAKFILSHVDQTDAPLVDHGEPSISTCIIDAPLP